MALDHTGRVLLSADYGGGSAASFQVTDGKLSPPVWTEHYTVHGPNRIGRKPRMRILLRSRRTTGSPISTTSAAT